MADRDCAICRGTGKYPASVDITGKLADCPDCTPEPTNLMRAALVAIQELHPELTVYEWDYDSGCFALDSDGEKIVVARLCLGCTPESIKEEIEDASYDAAGSYNDVPYPCPTRRLADDALTARTTKNGDNK